MGRKLAFSNRLLKEVYLEAQANRGTVEWMADKLECTPATVYNRLHQLGYRPPRYVNGESPGRTLCDRFLALLLKGKSPRQIAEITKQQVQRVRIYTRRAIQRARRDKKLYRHLPYHSLTVMFRLQHYMAHNRDEWPEIFDQPEEIAQRLGLRKHTQKVIDYVQQVFEELNAENTNK